MRLFPRTALLFALTLAASGTAFALPGVPAAGIPLPKVPEMPKMNCGVTGPAYLALLPGSGVVASATITLHNSQAQLYRASLCTVAAQRDLLVALNRKDLAEMWDAKVKNLSGTTVNAENQAALLAAAADVALNDALTAAAAELTGATEEQKTNIRKANLKRLSAGLALATLVVDAGRLTLDIASLVQKIASADPALVNEIVAAGLSAEAVKLWPAQLQQIVDNAGAFGKASKATDKSMKEVFKKAQIDPPTAADIKADLTASGDE